MRCNVQKQNITGFLCFPGMKLTKLFADNTLPVSNTLEKHHQKHTNIHQDAEESAVQAGISTEKLQSETEGTTERQ